MTKLLRFWKIIILDTLGVILMIAAMLTGWLPGPGGIPLFILGLSLLAIHHKWAKRYIEVLKKYADRLSDLIFQDNPKVQWLYDFLSPLLIAISAILLIQHKTYFRIYLGIIFALLGVIILLGNRRRWSRFINKRKN